MEITATRCTHSTCDPHNKELCDAMDAMIPLTHPAKRRIISTHSPHTVSQMRPPAAERAAAPPTPPDPSPSAKAACKGRCSRARLGCRKSDGSGDFAATTFMASSTRAPISRQESRRRSVSPAVTARRCNCCRTRCWCFSSAVTCLPNTSCMIPSEVSTAHACSASNHASVSADGGVRRDTLASTTWRACERRLATCTSSAAALCATHSARVSGSRSGQIRHVLQEDPDQTGHLKMGK